MNFVTSGKLLNAPKVVALAPVAPERNENTLTLRNVEVHFPFKAYSVQEQFMSKLLEALQRGSNALLESPTGTGKTLCILCACLAWQQSYIAAATKLKELQDVGLFDGSEASLKRLVGLDQNLARQVNAAGQLYQPPPVDSSSAPSFPGFLKGLGGMAGLATSPGVTSAEISIPAHLTGARHPRIIYASRTHSQLSQVIRELKSSGYQPKIAVLGSREQLCVHPTVSKQTGNTQSYACRTLTRTHRCAYKLELDEAMVTGAVTRKLLDGAPAIMDIEELATVGKRNKFCSYYFGREKETQQNADLVLLPYNYLIDPATRAQSLEFVDFNNSVIVFDEAHNVEQFAADAASFDLSAADLARCMEELRLAIEPYHKSAVAAATMDKAGTAAYTDSTSALSGFAAPQFDVKAALQFRYLMLQLEKWIDSLDLLTGISAFDFKPRPPSSTIQSLTVDGKPALVAEGGFIFEILERLSVNFDTMGVIVELLDKVIQFLGTRETIAASGAHKGGFALDDLKKFFQRVFYNADAVALFKEHYRVVIHTPSGEIRNSEGKHIPRGRSISLWCMSPGIAMRDLTRLGVRSIVLASGTLSPMDSYASELQLDFPVRLENPHVIDTSQVLVGVCKRSPAGTVLNSSFEHRGRDDYKRELGNTINVLLRSVPDGVLVFFPSYAMLNDCVTFWKTDRSGEVWRRIAGVKTAVIVEARRQEDFSKQIVEFNSAVEGKGGALLLAVCRGKVSEGIDFADARGRAVLVTGIPFPPHKDMKVMLKRKYLDERKATDASRISSGAWYNLQAYRSINQAIGRVIRHKNDYGAILLLDERFDRDRAGISAWLRPQIQAYDDTSVLANNLRKFFVEVEDKCTHNLLPPPATAGDFASVTTPQPNRYNRVSRPIVTEEDPTTQLLQQIQARKEAAKAMEQQQSANAAARKPTEILNATTRPTLSSLARDRLQLMHTSAPTLPFGLSSAAHRPTTTTTTETATRVLPWPVEPAPVAIPHDTSNPPDATRKDRALEYMRSLKSSLPTDKYDSFRAVLRDFKSSSAKTDFTAVSGLMSKLAELFRPHMTLPQLNKSLEGLLDFIPSDLRDYAEKAISKEIERGRPQTLQTNRAVDLVTGLTPAGTTQNIKMNVSAATLVGPHAGADVISGIKRARPEDFSETTNSAAFAASAHNIPTSIPSSATNVSSSATANAKSKCAVCLEVIDSLSAAPCGHILCDTCWDTTLAIKLECPLCRKNVRKKQLIRLHLND